MEVRCQVYVLAALLSSCKPHIFTVQASHIRSVAALMSWYLALPMCVHALWSHSADGLSCGLYWRIRSSIRSWGRQVFSLSIHTGYVPHLTFWPDSFESSTTCAKAFYVWNLTSYLRLMQKTKKAWRRISTSSQPRDSISGVALNWWTTGNNYLVH
jgi:hypothetical protein